MASKHEKCLVNSQDKTKTLEVIFTSNKKNNDKTNKSTFKNTNHYKSDLTCYICYKVGHMAKDCRFRSSHQKKNSQFIKDNDKKSNDRK